jgi:hypothetical protein
MCPVFGALFVSAQRIAGHAFSAHFMSYQYKSFATSVEISIAHKASFPNIIKFSYCPYALRSTPGRRMKRFSMTRISASNEAAKQ